MFFLPAPALRVTRASRLRVESAVSVPDQNLQMPDLSTIHLLKMTSNKTAIGTCDHWGVYYEDVSEGIGILVTHYKCGRTLIR